VVQAHRSYDVGDEVLISYDGQTSRLTAAAAAAADADADDAHSRAITKTTATAATAATTWCNGQLLDTFGFTTSSKDRNYDCLLLSLSQPPQPPSQTATALLQLRVLETVYGLSSRLNVIVRSDGKMPPEAVQYLRVMSMNQLQLEREIERKQRLNRNLEPPQTEAEAELEAEAEGEGDVTRGVRRSMRAIVKTLRRMFEVDTGATAGSTRRGLGRREGTQLTRSAALAVVTNETLFEKVCGNRNNNSSDNDSNSSDSGNTGFSARRVVFTTFTRMQCDIMRCKLGQWRVIGALDSRLQHAGAG
jgi:hypothetical protein